MITIEQRHIEALRAIAREPKPPSWQNRKPGETSEIAELFELRLLAWDAGGGVNARGTPARLRAPATRITDAGRAVLLAFELGREAGS